MAASGTLTDVAIRDIACAVSDNPVGNEAFVERFGAEHVEKFATMTGVRRRCVAGPRQTSSDFAYAAACDIFGRGTWQREEVDALIFVSQTPDYFSFPATACVLHGRLGLSKNCMAFDITLGCSGFVYGLFIAASLLHNSGLRRVLFCGGDTVNRVVSDRDKSAAMLFGDGGFAVAIESDPAATAPWRYLYRTDGTGYKSIILPAGGYRRPEGDRTMREFGEGIWRSDHNLHMDGTEVFNFTISEVPAAIKELMGQVPITPEQADLLVMHQANLFILKQISRMTKIPMTKVPVSMDRYGNTSVTSIPLTLCDALAGRPAAPALNLLLVGFGIGLSWGVINLKLSPSVCHPILTTNAFFEDGEIGHV